MLNSIVAGVAVVMFSGAASAESRVDRNLRIMLEAARQLEWSAALPDQGAYLLVKQETVNSPVGVILGYAVNSPVAVIFGYVDNRAACEQIAAALSAQGVATFGCDAIW